MKKKVLVQKCAKRMAEAADGKDIGMIRNVGHDGFYVLYFIVVNRKWKWYNQIHNWDLGRIYYDM